MSTITDRLKSSEFWLSLLALIIGGLMAAGVIGDGTIYARVGGIILTALSSMGYTIGATLAKASQGLDKPGFKTTEFWKAVAAALIAWVGSHLIPDGSKWAEIIDYLGMVLPVGTYAVARGVAKAASNDNAPPVAAPASPPPAAVATQVAA